MKIRILLMLVFVATVFCSPLAADGQTTATLAWNPVVDPRVTGYVLYWGTNSGNYIFSVVCASNQTSATVSNLVPNQNYYFAVATWSAAGQSGLSQEAVYTNATIANITPPSLPGTGTGSQTSGTGSQSSTGSGNTGSTGSPAPALALQETNIVGIPPVIAMAYTNGQINLTILGTVGADLMIQSTTNLTFPQIWTAVTNLTLTNAATLNPPLGQLPAALAAAFVPASQACQVSQTNSSFAQFYRTKMPYDYLILAATVLPAKGYGTRLIVVNMPGFVDDVCYETPDNNLIFCDNQTYGFGLEPSGSTIRQIAATFSSSLSLNWTSASEFIYSNGMSAALATVVETEDPSTDPVAGQAGASSPIVIDF